MRLISGQSNDENLERPVTVNEPGRFVRDILWMALSQAFTSMLGIVTLPALTRAYTTEEYGIWSQMNVTVGLVVPIVTLHFGTTVVRFLAGEDDREERRRAFGTMLFVVVILVVLLLAVVISLSPKFSYFLFENSRYGGLVAATSAWIFAEVFFTLFVAYLRALGHIRVISIVQVLFASLRIGLILIAAVLHLKLQRLVIGIAGAESLFALGVLVMLVQREGLPILKLKRLWVFLAFSLPQLPVGILIWIMNSSDRYFITHSLGLAETGIYSSSNSLGGILPVFYMPIAYVLFPVVSKAWEQLRSEDVRTYFESSTRMFLTMAIPAAVGLAMLSQPLLRILTSSEYLAGTELVLLIALGQVLFGIYSINEYIVYLLKKTNWLPLIFAGSVAISIALNFTLIPVYGIEGAAISKIAAYGALALAVVLWVRKRLRYSFDVLYVSKLLGATLLMALSLFLVRADGWVRIALAAITGLAVYAGALLVMKAFTERDKTLIKQVLRGVIPRRR